MNLHIACSQEEPAFAAMKGQVTGAQLLTVFVSFMPQHSSTLSTRMRVKAQKSSRLLPLTTTRKLPLQQQMNWIINGSA